MNSFKNIKAFTLIELLVVVAVIGILSAIAIPNFLSAQMRAKVSRCKSDMATAAGAIELYCVDYDVYPFSAGITPTGVVHDPTLSMAGYANKFLPSVMTTPLAYISDISVDIFSPITSEHEELKYYFYSNLEGAKEAYESQWVPAQQYRLETWGAWVFWSCGPDGDRIDLSPTKVGVYGPLDDGYYDPTNGVISNGDILRTQKLNSLGG